jgi:hypothetical protein
MLINLDKGSGPAGGVLEEEMKGKMDNLCEEIVALLNGLFNVANAAEDKVVMKKFGRVVMEVEPILKYFK